MSKHEEQLEKMLLGQLKITRADLQTWRTDPYLMDPTVVYRFWNYIENAPAVAIIGDYDCDGIYASYILGDAIKSRFPGKRLAIRIPKRHAEGYGINMTIVEELKAKLPKDALVITVDNGIAAANVLEELSNAGFKVIVTDHHEIGRNTMPKAEMVLDPAVDGVNEAFNGAWYWCGAAVAYKLCEQVVSEEEAKKLAVYAGIATVADCMPLKEGNWGLVKKSMQTFRDKKAPEALNNLLQGMRQNPEYANAETFGFYLGPATNAAGRITDDGPKLILSYLFEPTQQKCDQIIAYNEARKQIRDAEYELVKEQIQKSNQENACPIWVAVPGLHEGIVGILAQKVTEEYGVPAIVMTTSSEDASLLKGSARSIQGVDIFQFLLKHSDLFTKFGGHEGAAGLTLPAENLEKAQKAQIDLNLQAIEEAKQEYIKISHEEIPILCPIVEEFAPYGEGNPVPEFVIDVDVALDNAELFGSERNHLKIDKTLDGYRIIHWFHEPNDLADKNNFELIGTISLDGFRGYDFASFNAREAVNIHNDIEMGRPDPEEVKE